MGYNLRKTNKHTQQKWTCRKKGIQLAKQVWRKLKNENTNKHTQITLKIRTLIWNATVRAIQTYGLQTKTLTTKQYNKLENFRFNCHREMIEPQWILKLTEKQYISHKQIYNTLKRPIVETWLLKLRLTHYAKQTNQ